MADVYSSYQNPPLGVPAFEALDTYIQSNLLCSANPPLGPTVRILLASSLDLARYSVVGLDANGKLALAVRDSVDPADDIVPVGVLAHAAESGATNTTIFGEVHLTGDFNTDADSPLVWDASYNTEAEKIGAAGVANPNLMFRSRTAATTSQA